MFKKSKIFDYLLRILIDIGLFRSVLAHSQNVLTVLNYHRINDIKQESIHPFKPNISATPGQFELQMQYIKDNYHPISCEHLIEWIRGKKDLPQRAAIVTFDDGYYDNFAKAFPILSALSIPAIIFLATDFIGSKNPFYWDYVAVNFGKTSNNSVNLPLTGNVKWTSVKEREKIMRRWITALKKVSDDQKQEYIDRLPALLEVTISEEVFSDLYLNWDQVRYLNRNGIEFGSHTASHPILTRVDLTRVKNELSKSKARIEQEIGKPVTAFAYPNGKKDDFSQEIIKQIRKTGINVAFSLLPGPTHYNTVRKNPFAIRRIYIGNNDTFPRFIAKLSGISRIADW